MYKRDTTARQRIVDYLRTHGPVVDHDGRATASLMSAIGYESSLAAFIQLLAAMSQDGTVERQVRGRRTYEISLPGQRAQDFAGAGAMRLDAISASPVTAGGRELPVEEADYDELARWLLSRLLREVLTAGKQQRSIRGTGAPRADSAASPDAELESLRRQVRQLTAERDDALRRLDQANSMLAGYREAPDLAGADPGPERDLLELLLRAIEGRAASERRSAS
jgi:hypothetical protein